MKTALVLTSINAPPRQWLQAAEEARRLDWDFIVIGDRKSSTEMYAYGDGYYSLEQQKALPFSLAQSLPENHYSRKNLGYLIALKAGCEIVVETDDDNFPNTSEFWDARTPTFEARLPANLECTWLNPYASFSEVNHALWPRGLPLEHVWKSSQYSADKQAVVDRCYIQQGLADENPDVDAIYRMTQPLPITFKKTEALAIPRHVATPFNSQNTTFFKPAFPLLYLPSYVSFRMTDIWRSFIALRLAHEYDWTLAYTKATVAQIRNQHDLRRDLEQELPGIVDNDKIWGELSKLTLTGSPNNILSDLMRCYERLISCGFLPAKEKSLLNDWVTDIEQWL